MSHKIAYIVSRFPHLPETFILREMDALEKEGWDVSLYPLILQKQQVIHAEAKPWITRARKVPFFSLPVFSENMLRMSREPQKYFSILFRCLKENLPSPKFLVRTIVLFPKSVYAAHLMEEEGVEHIHAHYATHPALVAWIIHQFTGIGYTITVHAHDIFVERAMLEVKLKDAAIIRAISKFNSTFLTDCYGMWVSEKTHVVHCGIDPSHYRPSRGGRQAPGTFNIISIGSLQEYKGFPFLIKTCGMLRESGIPVHCKIVGGGDEYNKLIELIQEYQLENVVELLGSQTQDEVARLLPEADCYVQPSIVTASGKMEGIPVALMEALACGLPVVSSSLSGIPELVISGKTGYLVPPADSQALADILEEIYLNLDQARVLGEAGRDLVLKEFDLETNVRQLVTIFEQEVSEKSKLIR